VGRLTAIYWVVIGVGVIFVFFVASVSVSAWYPVWVNRVVGSTWFPFLPTFFGVLVGFGADRVWSYFQNYLGRRDLLRGVKVELERAEKLALALKGNLLPTDNWKSAIYSGRAMLLKQKIRSQIGEMYFAIDNHNYEAKIVRQLGEEARGTLATSGGGGVSFNQAKMHLWTVRSQELEKSEASLASKIRELLRESYWPGDVSE
jgi:hypothetical protein